ncbi:MAG: DHH family phosphoesterase [Planctomycetota bacterium]|nr:DHH family phosphoesterase [Planctomycetota bacterium]
MTIDWPHFVKIVRSHQRFLLTSHIRPDCDCLGSELAMADLLQYLGKDVLIVNGMRTPPNLAFLDPQHRIRTIGEDIFVSKLPKVDVLMILDTSAWVQLGPMAEVVRKTTAKKVLLDHHVSEDGLEAELFKDTEAEATGRLVLDAAGQLGVPLTAATAKVLFAAIATDTGWFRFGSTNAGTYRAAAQLVEAGARPHEIFRELYEQDTLGRVRLRGVVLGRFESEQDGRLVHTYVLKEDFTQTGALPSDTEDAINMGLAIAGTQMAVIMVEQVVGGFKVSFRSRCHVDCSRLAQQFGGGGHKAAAGAFVPGSLDEARTRVLDAVRVAMG